MSFYEAISGARMHSGFLRLGGISVDVPLYLFDQIYKWLNVFPIKLQDIHTVLTGNRIWRGKLIYLSRVGSHAQSKYLKKLVGTIKNDLTNYRQHLENAQIADEDEETDDIRLLKLKGRAIECMLYQDYLDISPIEETILFLIL